MDAFEAIKATFFQECDELLADLEAKLMQDSYAWHGALPVANGQWSLMRKTVPAAKAVDIPTQ